MIKYLIIFLFIVTNAYAGVGLLEENSNKFTFNGYVKDSHTGEVLIGATITVKELPQTGTATNAYGFYSLTIPEGTYTISAHFMGYEPLSFQVTLKQNVKQNFNLVEKSVEQKEVIITGERKDDNVTNIQMGIEKLDVKGIQSVPVLLGEKDVLKTVQLLPGI